MAKRSFSGPPLVIFLSKVGFCGLSFTLFNMYYTTKVIHVSIPNATLMSIFPSLPNGIVDNLRHRSQLSCRACKGDIYPLVLHLRFGLYQLNKYSIIQADYTLSTKELYHENVFGVIQTDYISRYSLAE